MTGEHRLRQAFLRRSLAYDLSGIATFSVLDLWTQNYSRRPALRSLLMLRSQSFQSMLKFYSTLILFKAMGATHMIVLKRPVLLERVRVHTTLTARESQQKEKEKPHRALLYQMTARSTLMESSFANDGRLEDAPQRSNLESDAWLDITCVGRRPVTSYIRATNAHTDFGSIQSTTVSPLLPQHLKFAVAPLACQTH